MLGVSVGWLGRSSLETLCTRKVWCAVFLLPPNLLKMIHGVIVRRRGFLKTSERSALLLSLSLSLSHSFIAKVELSTVRCSSRDSRKFTFSADSSRWEKKKALFILHAWIWFWWNVLAPLKDVPDPFSFLFFFFLFQKVNLTFTIF